MVRRSAVIGVVALAALALGDETAAKQTRDQLAEKHVQFAKKLEEKKFPREAFEELLLALELNPENTEAREKLGYKLDENKRWTGIPAVPKQGDGLEVALEKERDKEHKEAASKLASLARAKKSEGKNDEMVVLAGLALDEYPDDRSAREVLGFEKKTEGWQTPRERKIQAAFTKALNGAKAGDAKESPPDEAFTKYCQLGKLSRRESDHGVAWHTSAAPSVDSEQLLKAADATFVAYRYFLAGEDTGFSVEGEPLRAEAALAPSASVKPNWLVVADNEHAPFIEKTIKDEKEQALGKALTGYCSWHKIAGEQALIIEGHFAPNLRREWVSGTYTEFLTSAPLGVKNAAAIPDFISEGQKRFFSGHVSGRAEIFYTSGYTGRKKFQQGTFETLRSHVRATLRAAPEGELRRLLGKQASEMDAYDSGLALAFFDFMIATKRSELAKFLTSIKAGQSAQFTLERAVGVSVDALEADWRVWVRSEY
ncbi:MAG TPA: hypothetical protein VFF73_41940 [Planctomycetota bacterium]|nr:hypothetical protein [Planctomycetota bacterium]